MCQVRQNSLMLRRSSGAAKFSTLLIPSRLAAPIAMWL
jgi:hypothetical protein